MTIIGLVGAYSILSLLGALLIGRFLHQGLGEESTPKPKQDVDEKGPHEGALSRGLAEHISW
jgi:hypothetical protein